MNTKTTGIVLMVLIFGTAMEPIVITQADAMAPNKTLTDTPDAFFIRGDLIVSTDKTPFGMKDAKITI